MAAPADALANMPDQGAAPAPAQADPVAQPQADSAAQPQAPKPGLWHRVLQGALAGLEQGGVVGAAVGAVDPSTAIAGKQAKEQMRAAKIQFASAQAASLVAQEHARQRMLDQTDKQIANQASAVDEKFFKDIMDHGGVPSVITSDGSDKAHVAGLQQASDNSPNGVPEQLHLKMPSGQTVAFNMADLGTNQAMVHRINLYQAATGNPTTDAATLNNKSLVSPAYKTQLMQKARDFFNPIPAGNTPEAKAQSLDTLRQSYHNYLAQAQALPGSNPNKAELVDMLGDAVKRLDAWPTPQLPQTAALKPVSGTVNGKDTTAILTPSGWIDAQTHQSLPGFQMYTPGQIAEQRGKGYGEYRVQQILKPDGTLGFAYAKDVVNQGPPLQGSAPAAQGHKAMAQAAQINDIATGSQNMRQAVQGLDKPFDSAQIGSMTMAMRATDPKIMEQIVDAKLGAQTLTPGQQQFVVSLLNLHERAMALRSVAGIGQQGSDTMRNAIVAMLPALKDDPSLMLKKLDAFDQQLSVLSKGIPKVKGQPAPGHAPSATPQSHAFSLSAWQRANPNGNPAAARAAAEKAGYKVIQ